MCVRVYITYEKIDFNYKAFVKINFIIYIRLI